MKLRLMIQRVKVNKRIKKIRRRRRRKDKRNRKRKGKEMSPAQTVGEG